MLSDEEITKIINTIYTYIDNGVFPKLKEEIRFMINKQVDSYVLIDAKNRNFKSDTKTCCITMTAYQSSGSFRTLKDLGDYLGYPPNFCPFCGAKL